MPMLFELTRQLHRCGLLSISGIGRLIQSFCGLGVSPLTLLRLRSAMHPDRIALTDDREQLTYREFFEQSQALTQQFISIGWHQPGSRTAIVCRDHAALARCLCALPHLGHHVFLINPQTTGPQFERLHQQLGFDALIHDPDVPAAKISTCPPSLPTYDDDHACIDHLCRKQRHEPRLRCWKSGPISVLTSGTTGRPRTASRKPSLAMFLPPFCALLTAVRLGNHRSVYTATPVFHGFGLASLFMGIALGVTVHLRERFDAGTACRLIEDHRVEALTVVPVMLQRMLACRPQSLGSLKCIISGGAALNPDLALRVLDQLGPVLFNMYGTSEAGVCIMSDPKLIRDTPQAIGRPLPGVRVRVTDEDGHPVAAGKPGRLQIRSAWTIGGREWIETGDIASLALPERILSLHGRTDEMIVSGGENVYPIELEHVLVTHPAIDGAAVVGVPDTEFGQRLKAIVVRHSDQELTEQSLSEWLKSRVARHQMPAVIEFRKELPYSTLGKPDRAQLLEPSEDSHKGIE